MLANVGWRRNYHHHEMVVVILFHYRKDIGDEMALIGRLAPLPFLLACSRHFHHLLALARAFWKQSKINLASALFVSYL